jgi:hypothetical protein
MTQQPMTTREELVALAYRVEHHVGFFACQRMPISLAEWDRISNDLLDAAKFVRLASRQEVSVTVETQRLADAMWQLLDDMGTEGKTVCLAAKAGARVAYEPFRDKSEPEYDDWMPLADAERILKECGQ